MEEDHKETKHGTASSYNNLGCRCEACTEAASAFRQVWIKSLQDRPFNDVPHGTASGYRNWGCRCDNCVEARRLEGERHRAYNAAYRKRKREEKS